jgi:hypothetical protein
VNASDSLKFVDPAQHWVAQSPIYQHPARSAEGLLGGRFISLQERSPMTKPITDKAEVALEYPDKYYSGTFERSSRFEATLDSNGMGLLLEHPGSEEVRKSVHIHINFGLLADILHELSSQTLKISSENVHREQLQEAASEFSAALNRGANKTG